MASLSFLRCDFEVVRPILSAYDVILINAFTELNSIEQSALVACHVRLALCANQNDNQTEAYHIKYSTRGTNCGNTTTKRI